MMKSNPVEVVENIQITNPQDIQPVSNQEGKWINLEWWMNG